LATDRLIVQGLRAGYGQSEVLHGIDFKVGAAEIVVVVGRNGMGKSTLMRTLIGMIDAKSGTITLDGQDITALKSHQRVARGLAFVPQGRMIFPTMTVQENIETGLFVHGGRRVPPDIYTLFPVHAAAATCPGVSSSSSRSPVRWPPTPRSYCSMSRPRASSPASFRRWRGRCAASVTNAA